MWQRFTEHARRVVFYAQEEANRLGTSYVTTEHILLGLLREPDCTAVKILGAMGVSTYEVRKEIESQVAADERNREEDMQLTPRAKRVIDHAYSEAKSLGGEAITSKHLLLGLIREGDGMAARVLQKLGVNIDLAHQAAASLQDMETTTADPEIVAKIQEMRDEFARIQKLNKETDGTEQQLISPDKLTEAHKLLNVVLKNPPLRDESRAILQGIIEEYGREICSDRERCTAMLWERRGEYTREIMAFIMVLHAGIIEDMYESSNIDHNVMFNRLIQKVAELTPIDRAHGFWAIVSWALALGIINEKD